jgi:membrane-associated phospholipid phosphatase
MALVTIRPTNADVAIANAISAHTGPRTEKIAEAATWGADEHILCALALGWWLYTRNRSADQRRTGNHILLTMIVASALPHGLKTVFDQERPDRRTVCGHWRGIPFSGKPMDAFPSGHAVHIGALASAASVLPDKQRMAIWSAGSALVLTRIILLAHWTSDVAVGLVVGALVERVLRPITGYGRRPAPAPGSYGRAKRKFDQSGARKPTDQRTAVAESRRADPEFRSNLTAERQPGSRSYSAATLLDF